MTLAVTPCCAFDNCGDNEQTEKADNKKSNDCETPCSPFVTCACCAGVCITPSIDFLISPDAVTEKTITLYNQSFTSFYYAIIWQPPKIVC